MANSVPDTEKALFSLQRKNQKGRGNGISCFCLLQLALTAKLIHYSTQPPIPAFTRIIPPKFKNYLYSFSGVFRGV